MEKENKNKKIKTDKSSTPKQTNVTGSIDSSIKLITNVLNSITSNLDSKETKMSLNTIDSTIESLKKVTTFNQSLTLFSTSYKKFIDDITGSNGIVNKDYSQKITEFAKSLPNMLNSVNILFTDSTLLSNMSADADKARKIFSKSLPSYIDMITGISGVLEAFGVVINSSININKSNIKKFKHSIESIYNINKIVSETFAQAFPLTQSKMGDLQSKEEARSEVITNVLGNTVTTIENISQIFEKVQELKFKPFGLIQRKLFTRTLKNVVKIYTSIKNELSPLIEKPKRGQANTINKTSVETIKETLGFLVEISNNIKSFLKNMMLVSTLSILALPIITIGFVAFKGVLAMTTALFNSLEGLEESDKVAKASAAIKSMSLAMIMMIGSLALTGVIIMLAWNPILWGLIGLIAIVGMMYFLSKLVINVTGDFVKAGIAIAILSGTLILMAASLAITGLILGTIDWMGLLVNLAFMTAVFAAWGAICFGVGLIAVALIPGALAVIAVAGSLLIASLLLSLVSKIEIGNVDTQIAVISQAMTNFVAGMPNVVSMTLAMVSAVMMVGIVTSLLVTTLMLWAVDKIEFKKEGKEYAIYNKVTMIGQTIDKFITAMPGPIRMALATVAAVGGLVVVTSLTVMALSLKLIDSMSFDNVETNMNKIIDVLFGESGFVSRLPGPIDLIKITANIIPILGLAAMIGSLGAAIQSIAQLRMPTGFDSKGNALGYRAMSEEDFVMAGNNISKCLISILTPLANFTLEHPEFADVFAPQGLFRGNSQVANVIATSKDLGMVISGLALGLKDMANLRIATEWDKDGNPTKWEAMTPDQFTLAGSNISNCIVSMIEPLAALAVNEKYADVFEKDWLGRDSKVANVINTSKTLMEVVGGIAKDIVSFAKNEYKGPDGKVVKLGETDIDQAGTNIQAILTKLVDAAGSVEEVNLKNFDKFSGSYGKFIEKINTVDLAKLTAANNMMKNLSEFSKSINGNFDKLADTINEKLIKALEELKDVLEKTEGKSGTNAPRIVTMAPVAKQPIKTPATPAKPVPAVKDTEIVDKIDDLIEQIRSGIAIKNAVDGSILRVTVKQ